MRSLVVVLLYVLSLVSFGLAARWMAARVPVVWLGRSRGLLRLRRWEYRGRCYDQVLRLHRWKHNLHGAGALGGGISMSEALCFDTPSLLRFTAETRRAELVHWANVAFGLTFWAWSPTEVAVVMTLLSAVVHAPFIVVQRDNRAKTEWILEHRGATEPAVWPSRTRRIVRASAAGVAVSILVVAVGAARRSPTRGVSLAEAVRRLDSVELDGEAATLIPAEGVYRFTGGGTERLGPFEPTSQGPTLPATVEHTSDGCWSFLIDYNSRHWQRFDFCSEDGRLIERGGASEQKFDIVALEVSATTTTTCPADTVAADPGGRTGGVAAVTCEVTSSGSTNPLTSSGPTTLVGREAVTVGGVDREALHYRRERTFSGSQFGTERVDLWFDMRSGLPLRSARQTKLTTESPVGTLTYVDDGFFELTKLDPI